MSRSAVRPVTCVRSSTRWWRAGTAVGEQPPRRGEIHVWSVPLSVHAEDMPALRGVLSVRERARADRFQLPADRRRFTVSRYALRSVLGDCSGLAPRSLEFRYGRQGKPYLDSPGAPHFSLSHSGELSLIAVCRDEPVGVDVEYALRVPDVMYELVDAFFSPTDRRQLLALPAESQRDAFFRCWTRKEALVKALGVGLLSKDGRADGRWSLHQIEPAAGYVGAVAVAVRRTGWTVVTRPFARAAGAVSAERP
ncbi:4'-phosphopantetheinyl transferase family protein [Streptomyces sp. NPDC052236]|uniref:4'-phosphopantetheinyl transferase family protein n=1 Tax=Streptomyces sp. NPDC052236 TaxID=3365686 RepID=UPI0037D548E8